MASRIRSWSGGVSQTSVRLRKRRISVSSGSASIDAGSDPVGGSGRSLIYLVALGSGAAALIYQAVWLRWFGVLFGNTAYSASATLGAFFTGLAAGSALFGRIADRTRRPLRVYAAIEALAAVAALLVPVVFNLYDPIYAALYDRLAEQRFLFTALKFSLAIAVMLPPSILLGGTLPLLAAAFVSDPRRLGSQGVALYAINTMGAAAGSAAGLLWLPDAIGIRETYGVGIALSLLVALSAFGLAGRARPLAERSSEHPTVVAPAPRSLLLVAFASGFGTLALEVLIVQALARILDHSIYSLGSVLVVVLLTLAAGAGFVSLTANRFSARRLLAAALLGEAALLLILPAFIDSHALIPRVGPLLRGFALALIYGGPALLFGALVLPLTFRIAAGGPVGRRVGGLLAVNTLGGILGSVGASLLMLDLLGLWTSVACLGVAYGVAWTVVGETLRGRLVRGSVLVVGIGIVFASPMNPLRVPAVAVAPNATLLASVEGAYGVVNVVEDGDSRRMRLNTHYVLSGSGAFGRRKERLGHLPLLLHPNPKRVLFVGSATGQTAGSAVVHPVEEIVLVEIVPEVQHLAGRYFAEANRFVYQDPRTRSVVEDGRNHLRATRERYDVIVSDLFSIQRAGVGSLYTRDHFAAVRDHLNEGGVFCQWLPLYEMGAREFSTLAATFLDVFPGATVWRGNFYASTYVTVAFVGFKDRPPSEAAVEKRVAELAAAGVDDRWVTHPEGFWMLYVGPLARLARSLQGVPLNTDDHPLFEYVAARSTFAQRRDFLNKDWPSLRHALDPGDGEAASPFAERARAGARRGELLTRANRLVVSGEREAARTAMRQLIATLPRALWNPPDPTVAEIWQVQGRRAQRTYNSEERPANPGASE